MAADDDRKHPGAREAGDGASELSSSPSRGGDRLIRLLHTPEQAATILSIGRSKLYELLGSRELESVRIGGSRRIPSVALYEFVEQQRRDAVKGKEVDGGAHR